MSAPSFSIVIPTFNRLSFLQRAVDSVQRQTLADWELWIVDDGSDDDTAAYCRGLPESRIHFVQLPHCGVVGRVRNEGARRAEGRYLAFLDSDDEWHPTKLERQIAALEGTGAQWSHTGYELIGPSGERLGTWQPQSRAWRPGELLLRILATESAVAMSSLAVSRATFWRLGGFSTHPRIREDHDLFIRLVEAGTRGVAVPEVLLTMREHPRRSSLGEHDPFERSAIAYEQLLERAPKPDVAICARRVLARHLIPSAGARRPRGCAEEAPNGVRLRLEKALLVARLAAVCEPLPAQALSLEFTADRPTADLNARQASNHASPARLPVPDCPPALSTRAIPLHGGVPNERDFKLDSRLGREVRAPRSAVSGGRRAAHPGLVAS
jgi:hypothetical protein